MAGSNFLQIFEFMSEKNHTKKLNPKLIQDYLVLCNFFVFLNTKNVNFVQKYIDYFMDWPEHKSALNILMQIAHYTNKLSVLWEIGEKAVQKFIEIDILFCKKGGFSIENKPQLELTSTELGIVNLNSEKLINLLELLHCLIHESNHHSEQITELIFNQLKKSESFRQVYLFELFNEQRLDKLKSSYLSHISLKLSAKLLLFFKRHLV